MKPRLNPFIGTLVAISISHAAHAAPTITFESPYTTGALSTTPVSVLTDRPFDGQQGWSRSTSSSVGNIITTTTSGTYTGGQGLTASTGTAETYIGAKAVGAFDSYVFDFRYDAREVVVGGWNDDDGDGLFDQSEVEFMAGTVEISSSTSFGLRTANFGNRLSTGTSGTNGSWYRMTVTPDFANLQVSLAVFNLTSNSAVTLGTSVFTLTSAEFGVDPTLYEGVATRLTSSSATPVTLDNIQIGTVSGFTGWINTNYPSLLDKTTGGDPDNDGITNLMEYVLNGNPGASSTNILPAADNSDPTDLIFTFTRREESAGDTTQIFQYGTDLSSWTDINITGTPGAEVTLGTPAGGLQLITVKVPKSAAVPSGKLFGRLQVTQP